MMCFRRIMIGYLVSLGLVKLAKLERLFDYESGRENNEREPNLPKEEPAGFQFRAMLFDTSPESKDAFYDELTEPLSMLKSEALQTGETISEKIESMILIKLKIVNKGKTTTGVSYLCIDHVYDRKKGTVFKLLNTIVFKIKQEQISLVYDLSILQVVNGLPQEEVINKNREGFTGCTVEGNQPTCGLVSFSNITIPFSEGFCCSCDPNVNKERERQLVNLCIEYEKNKYYNISMDGKINLKQLPTSDDLLEENIKTFHNQCHFVNKRTIEKTGIQIRGGQSCIDRTHPKDADPVKYHESAHCLRFSKLWYNVFKLHEPKQENIILLQMFRKRHPERAASNWLEITKGTPSILGSSFRSFSSDRYQTLFSYAEQSNNVSDELKLPRNKYLLKPHVVERRLRQPFSKGGAKEYLLVDSKLFDFDGGSCDKIGVSYTAFSKQKNRCGVPKGTCLYNQPYALWLYDKKRLRRGLKGKYMLKNFAAVTDEEMKNSLADERLHLDFNGNHVTKISVGIDNFIDNVISTSPHGILTEIYIDAANEYSTSFIINMINDGLVESTYRVALANLPEPLPKVWHATPSNPFTIAAHNGFSIRLQMYGKLPLDKFHATVQLQTAEGLVLSSRRATVQNNDRCYCVWECECACEASELGLHCQVLDQQSYNKAGYQGAPPPRRPTKTSRILQEPLLKRRRNIFLLITKIIAIALGLLIMGVMMAVVRWIVYVCVCCCSYEKTPRWKYFRWKLVDGALIPLFVCNNKTKITNNVLINVFYFWLVPVAFVCFIFHLLTLRKEIFGKKEIRVVQTPYKRRKTNWFQDESDSQEDSVKKPLLQPRHVEKSSTEEELRQQQHLEKKKLEKRKLVKRRLEKIRLENIRLEKKRLERKRHEEELEELVRRGQEDFDEDDCSAADDALKSKELWIKNQKKNYRMKIRQQKPINSHIKSHHQNVNDD